MAIDIRATVTCSLGTLISASISDDYVQGTGLIKCKGSCELSGIVTPAVGTAVTFSYTKNGITRKIPRKLRVMSSFADPFRRTTKVELGCKLTYLSDLQEPIDWTPFDDILNNTFTVDDAKIITIPIHASSVMDKCLDELGITATSNPLTSKFSIARFDFGPGYVQVLSDLLVSESYCGYLNRDEQLVVFSLDQKGGTGPVISTGEIIDLGPIGVGQLPGEAVVVSYSTLMLQAPDAGSQGTVNWEEQEDVQVLQPLVVAYGENQTRSFTGRQVTTILTEYETISLATAVSTGSWFYWQSLDQYRDVVTTRTTTVTSPSAYVEDKRVSELLTNGIAYANTDIVSTKTVETTEYARTTAEPLRKETLVYQDRRMAYSSLGLQLVYSASDYVNPSGLILVGKTVEEYEKSGSFTKTVRNEYVWAPTKQAGSQGVAQARESFADATEVAAYLGSIEGVLVHNGSSVSTTEQGVTTYQGRPAASERTNAAYASGDPNNGWRTVSTAQLELAVGSATAQRRIELSLPYPADDTFTKVGSPPTYGYTVSDVKEKATRYGRSQNRLLLGNRSGMNLQMAPEKLPAAPFAPFVVQANGVSGLYRTNGTSWQLSADGALVSVDALFWGAVGGTGDFFFPVAPGITTLPTAPAVTDTSPTTVLGTVADVGANPQTTLTAAFPSATSGQGAQDLATDEFWTYNGSTWTNVGTAPGPTSTVSTVVPVWNETVVAIARTSTKLAVTSLAYPLTLLTEAAAATKTKLVSRAIKPISIPAAVSFTLLPRPLRVVTGASAKPPVAAVSLTAAAPTVAAGKTVAPAVVELTLAANAPAYVGKEATVVQPLATTLSVAGVAPTINTPIAPPVATIGLTPFLPLIWREPIEFVGAGTIGSSTASFGSLPWPTHKANDIGLWVIETEGGSTDITPPTGWAAVPGSPVQDTGASGGSKLHLWWKRATNNAEPTVTVPDSGDHQVARIFAFRGCVSVGDPWDATTTGSKVVASTTATVPAVTTTTFNTQVVMIIGRPNDTASTTEFSNPVNGGLVGLVEHGEAGTTQGFGGGFVVLSGRKELPGSTGTTTVTKASSTTDTYIVLALKS